MVGLMTGGALCSTCGTGRGVGSDAGSGEGIGLPGVASGFSSICDVCGGPETTDSFSLELSNISFGNSSETASSIGSFKLIQLRSGIVSKLATFTVSKLSTGSLAVSMMSVVSGMVGTSATLDALTVLVSCCLPVSCRCCSVLTAVSNA